MDGSEPARPIQERDIIARITAYSTLRAAERALHPTVCRRRALPTADLARRVLSRLRDILSRLRVSEQPDSRELDEVDRTLVHFGEELRLAVESIPLAQMRATLPMVARQQREDALALLDVCLGSEAPHLELLHVVDYLVTLLSCDRSPSLGCKQRVCDPSTLTPHMIELAADAGDVDEEIDRQIETFGRAPGDVESLREAQLVVREMRACKRALGGSIFIPEVLRAVVDYNVSVANTLDRLMAQEREHDALIDRTLAALRSLDDVSGSPGALSSPGLLALEQAVRERLASCDAPPGPAACVANHVELCDLDDVEVEALTEPRNAGLSPLLRASIIVGLALRELPEIEPALASLDIEAHELESEWVSQLRGELAKAVAELERQGRHVEAQTVARTQEKYLPLAS